MTTSWKTRRVNSSASHRAVRYASGTPISSPVSGVVKDENGEITELRCTYDPATRGGDAPDGRKVKSTLHWVSAEHSIGAEIRLYDRLFTVENPAAEDDFRTCLNPNSLEVLTGLPS